MTDAHFAWRISAAARHLRVLVETRARGEWTARTTSDLWQVERQIRQLLNEAQLAAIRAALRENEH